MAILISSLSPLASVRAANILISNDACVGVAATPAPDVEYKPGMDVNGNAVAPADLAGSAPAIRPPDTIKIPLQINLQNALHLNNSNLYSPDAVVGTIEYKNGQVTFNGQPVSEDAAAQIKAACQTVPKSEILSGPRSKNLLMGE